MPAPDFIAQPAVSALLKALKGDAVLEDGHKEMFLARAPGRLDLIGGITDYSGGLVCQYPLAASAAVAVQRRDDRQLVIKNFTPAAPGAPAIEQTVTLSLDDFYGTASLLPHDALQDLFAGPRGWAANIAGAFPILARHKKITRSTHGATIACFSDIPAGAGGSAALACATLWAMTAAYHTILDPMEIASLAHRMDNQIAGSTAGIADCVTAVFGKAGQLMMLECQPHELKGYASLPPGCFLAGISTGRVAMESEAHRAARVGAFMAQTIVARVYRDLGVKKDPTRGYLANVPLELFQRYFSVLLPESITGAGFVEQFGPNVDRAVAIESGVTYHPRAVAVQTIIEVSRARVVAGGLALLNEHADNAKGRQLLASFANWMYETHAGYTQKLGLSSPEVDMLVKMIEARGPERGFLGARLNGAGAAGTVVLLAEESTGVRRELAAILDEYRQKTGFTPALLEGTSAGACETVPARLPVSQLSA